MKNWKINLAACWLSQFLCIVGFTAAYSYLPFYIRELGVNNVDEVTFYAGLQASAGAVMMALVSPIWGSLADRHGRKVMVERAAFAGAVIVTSMAFVTNPTQLVLLRALEGAFTGTIPAFVSLVASFAPPGEIGFALGMMQMAVYTGFTAGPLIGGVIADGLGYRWTFGATGILLLLGGGLVFFIVREHLTLEKRLQSKHGLRDSMLTLTHSLPLLGAVLALGGIYMGNSAPQPVTALFVESLQPASNLINTSTGIVLGMNAVASAVSAVFIGRLSDQAGYRTILLIASTGATFSYLAQGLSTNVGLLILFSFITGLCTGGLLPAANAIVARNAPLDKQGAIYGISNSINAVGRALGPMLGAAFAGLWGLRAAFGTAAVLFVVVTAWISLAIRTPQPTLVRNPQQVKGKIQQGQQTPPR